MNHGLDSSQSALAKVTYRRIIRVRFCITGITRLDAPVIEGEGQIVPGGGEGVLAPSGHGGGEVPGGLGSASGDLGEHLLS